MPRLLVFLLFILPFELFAKGLVALPQRLSSQLLPRGLWMFSYNMASSSTVDSQFNSDGDVTSFRSHLSRDLQVEDVLKSMNEDFEKNLAEAAFQSYDIKNQDFAGTVVNDLKIKYSSQTPVMGYGLTDSINIFFIAPRISFETEIRTRLHYSEAILNMVRELQENGEHSRAAEILENQEGVLSRLLAQYDYEPDYVSRYEGVPQFHLLTRYASESMKSLGLLSETTLIIPNESNQFADQFTPLEIFEESPSLIQTLSFSQNLGVQWQYSGLISYQLRTPHERSIRVPLDSETSFSGDKRSTEIRYGDETTLGLQVSRPDKVFTPFLNVLFKHKQEDRYSSAGISSDRFDSLTNGSEQTLTTGTLGLSINTVDLFLRNRFLIPFEMTILGSQALSGRNSFKASVLSLNVMVFYQ